MRHSAILLTAACLLIAGLACSIPGGPTAEPPDPGAVATAVAATIAAGAAPATEPPPTVAPPTAAPSPSETPGDLFAPDPLPAMQTGIILLHGECYDLDNGNAPYLLDADCDMLFVPPYIIQMQNGARISGYASMSAPSKNGCIAARYEPGDLSPNTDLYMCFQTNEGHYGFVVQRADGAPFETASQRLIFDWWVYP